MTLQPDRIRPQSSWFTRIGHEHLDIGLEPRVHRHLNAAIPRLMTTLVFLRERETMATTPLIYVREGHNTCTRLAVADFRR